MQNSVWYFGEGDQSEMRAAVKELSDSSDRVIAIVGAGLLETRLTTAIQSELIDDKAACKRLFSAEGALGAFGAKIQLAYMMGLISGDARSDLSAIKDIRNKFAHRLAVSAFGSSDVAPLCGKLKLVDRFIVEAGEGMPVVAMRVDLPGRARSFYDDAYPPISKPVMSMIGAGEALKSERNRFLYSIQVLNILLGWHLQRLPRNPAF